MQNSSRSDNSVESAESVESDISDIGDIKKPRIGGAQQKGIVIRWDEFKNVREIAGETGRSLRDVQEALKRRQRRRIEREFRKS